MKYIASALNGFENVLIFKTNLMVKICSIIVQSLLSIITWNAIYAGSNHKIIGGYSRPEMISYLILASLLSILFTMEPIFNLSKQVKDGTISAWLIRPISINGESLSNFIGNKIIFILLMIIYLLVIGINNLMLAIFNIIYFLLAIIVWHELMYLIGLLSFWLIQMWPLEPILNGVYLFLGGLLFPLSILPQYLYNFVRFTPFSLVSSDLVQVVIDGSGGYLTKYVYILSLFIWYFILRCSSRWLFKKGIRKFEGVGI